MITLDRITELVAPIETHLDRLGDRIGQAIAPPAPARPMTAFAGTLRPGEGRTKAEGRELIMPANHAPQWYTMQAFEGKPRRYRTYLTIGPTGDGKSMCTINIPIMHALFEREDDVVYAGPTRQLLNKLFRTKLRRMMLASNYGHMLPVGGPGSGGGVADDIRFSNGSTMFPMGGGGKGESAQAGVHARWAFYEEYDDMPADEVQRVEQRTSAHGLEHQLVKTTTIKQDVGSRTIAEYLETTRCRVEFGCVHCGGWNLWKISALAGDWTSTRSAAATVRIACRHCGVALTPDEHLQCLKRHRLVSIPRGDEPAGGDEPAVVEIPDVDAFGMWWSSLDSPRKGLQYVAVKYASALLAREKYFNHEPMRQFTRDELALPYLDEDLGQAAAITDQVLGGIARAATYRRGQAPGEAQRLFMGEDCQLRSHYWIALPCAWDADAKRVRWWITDWGELSVCGAADQPDVRQRHAVLDQVDAIAEAGYPVMESSHRLIAGPGSSAVDTAYHPREVRPWVARRRHRWLSMRGCGQDQFGTMREPRKGSLVQSVKGVIVVYEQPDTPDRLQGFAAADELNDVIESDLHTGHGWIPQDSDNKLAFHLLGIRRGGAGDKEPWVEVHRRHDWRDCLIYALARAYQYFNQPTPSSRPRGIIGNMIRK